MIVVMEISKLLQRLLGRSQYLAAGQQDDQIPDRAAEQAIHVPAELGLAERR